MFSKDKKNGAIFQNRQNTKGFLGCLEGAEFNQKHLWISQCLNSFEQAKSSPVMLSRHK